MGLLAKRSCPPFRARILKNAALYALILGKTGHKEPHDSSCGPVRVHDSPIGSFGQRGLKNAALCGVRATKSNSSTRHIEPQDSEAAVKLFHIFAPQSGTLECGSEAAALSLEVAK